MQRYIKTHQTIHHKPVQIIVCQLYVSKAAKDQIYGFKQTALRLCDRALERPATVLYVFAVGEPPLGMCSTLESPLGQEARAEQESPGWAASRGWLSWC